MNETIIKVENLSKVYKLYDKPIDRLKESLNPFKKYHKDFYALKDVSFEIKKGETVGIIGKNGSGKSTLLKIITGVLTQSSGLVELNGKISALLELGGGFNPEFTGIENIYLNGTIMGYSKEEMDNKLEDILSFADIGDFVKQPVKTYSSGMFVRLAFAVAISVNPDILIVDEALAVGDALFQRKCFLRIEDFRNSGKTILFVTHDIGTILELCDRAILLDSGEKLMMSKSGRVVPLYNKLLYAPEEKKQEVREQIKKIDISGNYDFANENKGKDLSIFQNDIKEFFDPVLLNTNAVYFESCGSKIQSFEIISQKGEKVNVLKPESRYIWRYHVIFNKKCSNVRFNMMIKMTSGFPLGGSYSSAPSECIKEINAGEDWNVEFEFNPKLAPGIYFLNCGVTSIENGSEIVLDRIADATSFRVLAKQDSLFTSTIDFDIFPNYFNVSN